MTKKLFLLALAATVAVAQNVAILADGHVHVTNRVYWEGIDPWKPQPTGDWDYARAKGAGINFVIESVAPYGYQTYNTTVKQAGRLIETALHVIDTHKDKVELALTASDVRRIAAKGKMAVMLGIEAGFDQEGDVDILRLWYRLGVRVIQFTSQNTNAFADSGVRGGVKWHGINEKGRKLIAEMNRLGMLIDISHATEEGMLQIIEASNAPVVASHVAMRAICDNPGNMTDAVLKALVAKGGMVGIHSSADLISNKFYEWSKTHPATPVNGIDRTQILYADLPLERARNDYGEYIEGIDKELGGRWRQLYAKKWTEDPAAMPFVPTIDQWVDHVEHVAKIAGADRVALGMDITNARSTLKGPDGRPIDSSSYQLIVTALRKRGLATPGILGENWLKVLDRVQKK
ncbi:MAG: membrane dipeptidase [Acidobacteriota bacterium]